MAKYTVEQIREKALAYRKSVRRLPPMRLIDPPMRVHHVRTQIDHFLFLCREIEKLRKQVKHG